MRFISKYIKSHKALDFVFEIIFFPILQIFVSILSIIEIPLFIFKNRELFRNQTVYPFWHWSFGHQVLGYDWASRLFFPNRISIVLVPNFRNNLLLHKCYEHNMDCFIFKSKFMFDVTRFGKIRYKILKFYLYIINIFNSNFEVIERSCIYKMLSLTSKLKYFDENKNKISNFVNTSGFIKLLTSTRKVKPFLNDELNLKCKKEIERKFPTFFEKPFICLLLRKPRSKNYFDRMRGSTQKNYIKTVKYFISNGYNVVGTGETDDNLFSYLSGYYNFNELDVDLNLTNLFILTNCSLFISQHSGAYILPNIMGIPIILTDSFPFYIGTYNPKDVILFKTVKLNGKKLSIQEIISNHTHLVYGNNPQNKYEILDNTEEEILKAVQKCGIKKFNFPSDTLIHFEKNFIVDNVS